MANARYGVKTLVTRLADTMERFLGLRLRLVEGCVVGIEVSLLVEEHVAIHTVKAVTGHPMLNKCSAGLEVLRVQKLVGHLGDNGSTYSSVA